MTCAGGIRRKLRPIPSHQDQEDATPDDYEREIDRPDQAIRGRSR